MSGLFDNGRACRCGSYSRGIIVAPVSRNSFFRKIALIALALVFGAPLEVGAARAQGIPQRVLMLYPYNTSVPANVLAGETAKKRLMERAQKPLEFHTEFLDFERFATDGNAERMARHLAEKYQDRKPAVILAIGPSSLQFPRSEQEKPWLRSADRFLPDVPRAPRCHRSATPTSPESSASSISTKTLSLAQRLQPDARSIVVVSGASEFDRQWTQIARRQLAPYEQSYEMTYLEGLRHDDLMRTLKSLPRDTIVIMLTVFGTVTAASLFRPRW